ncbi:hypothetical protein [Gillisia sp. JM1]|uniref:hypothetical protein n=1 Tax=Gillisia sp. JM1 TaxID=1283286 RepID=UPI0003FA76FB|nr:hypothetical protein [Gillisia sp. JM1]
MKDFLKNILIEYFWELQKENWPGKERELVSRFAFSKLVKNINRCPEFYDPSQIGLEVRVKQNQGDNRKEFVCKDLIIWKKPNSNVWTKQNIPILIMEWKHNNFKPSEYDIKWLQEYTLQNQSCIGIAINIDNKKNYKLSSSLIENGEINEANWLVLNAT